MTSPESSDEFDFDNLSGDDGIDAEIPDETMPDHPAGKLTIDAGRPIAFAMEDGRQGFVTVKEAFDIDITEKEGLWTAQYGTVKGESNNQRTAVNRCLQEMARKNVRLQESAPAPYDFFHQTRGQLNRLFDGLNIDNSPAV